MNAITKLKIKCYSCNDGYLINLSSLYGEATCGGCKKAYTIKNGVIDLLEKPTEKRSVAQFLMEWKPLIRVYEGPLWRKNLFFMLMTRVSFKRELAKAIEAVKLKESGMLLDLACGPGNYSRPLARKLSNGGVVGLDLSGQMLDYASSKARAEGIENLTLIRGDALHLPFPENTFDAINCAGAIHLFSDIAKVMSEIYRVLKPGCRFVTNAFYNRVPGYTGRKIAKINRRFSGVYNFQKEEMKELFKNAGFIDIEIHHAKGIFMILSGAKSG